MNAPAVVTTRITSALGRVMPDHVTRRHPARVHAKSSVVTSSIGICPRRVVTRVPATRHASNRSGDQPASGYQVAIWSSSFGNSPAWCHLFCAVSAATGSARTALPLVAVTVRIGMSTPSASAAVRSVATAMSPPKFRSTTKSSASQSIAACTARRPHPSGDNWQDRSSRT